MRKRVFDINQSYGKTPIMVCYTREQSDVFREFLHRSGKTWRDGRSYSALDYYNSCPKGVIYYNFVRGTFSRVKYNHDSYEFLDFEELNVYSFEDDSED